MMDQQVRKQWEPVVTAKPVSPTLSDYVLMKLREQARKDEEEATRQTRRDG